LLNELPGTERLPAVIAKGLLCEGALLMSADEVRTSFAKRGGLKAICRVLKEATKPERLTAAADTLVHLTRFWRSLTPSHLFIHMKPHVNRHFLTASFVNDIL